MNSFKKVMQLMEKSYRLKKKNREFIFGRLKLNPKQGVEVMNPFKFLPVLE
jgi:hypothetical protein